MPNAITEPTAIEAMRWRAIRAGLKLEHRGLRKRGQSCMSIAKHELGLNRHASYPTVMGAVEAHIEALDAKLAKERANGAANQA